MSKLSPISSSSTDPFERALLRSVERDRPGRHAVRRAAVALGLGIGAFSSAANAGGVSAAISAWMILKPLGIGVLSGAVLSVAAHSVGSDGPAPTHQVGVKPQPVSPAPRASADPATVVAEPAPVALPATDRAPAERATVTSKPSTSVGASRSESLFVTEPVAGAPPSSVASFSAPPKTASIGEEIACIDRARHALGAGRPSEALAEIGRYRARFPAGVLAMEALILGIEARLKLGDRATAAREADTVISSQPSSRYAARLRALFATAGSDQRSGSPTSNEGR